MGDDQHGFAGPAKGVNLAEAFLLEVVIADGQDFIDQEDVGIDLDSHGKPKAHVHAGGIVFDGLVDEIPETGKIDDGLEALAHLPTAQAHDRAGQEDVFAACEVGMKAGPELQQGRDGAGGPDPAGGRNFRARQQGKQSAFTGAVGADNPQRLAAAHRKINIPQGPEGVFPGAPVPHEIQDGGFDGAGSRPLEAEAFAHLFDDNRAIVLDRVCHSSSPKRGSTARNTPRPIRKIAQATPKDRATRPKPAACCESSAPR